MNWRKRKKLNKLAKKHGLIHGYEYKRFIRKKVIKIKRLPGGENWKYPAQVHVDLAQHPDVTTEARIGISPKGDVKFYGFDICKT